MVRLPGVAGGLTGAGFAGEAGADGLTAGASLGGHSTASQPIVKLPGAGALAGAWGTESSFTASLAQKLASSL
jgi:hypothetical protein